MTGVSTQAMIKTEPTRDSVENAETTSIVILALQALPNPWSIPTTILVAIGVLAAGAIATVTIVVWRETNRKNHHREG